MQNADFQKFQVRKSQKDCVRKFQIRKVSHLRKVRKSKELFKSVKCRICKLRNLFAGRPPLLFSKPSFLVGSSTNLY
jgi:hypothetical protein